MELNSSKWNIKQIIQVKCDGLQLCFISDSKFLYQGKQECLEIYEYQLNERQFRKVKTIELQKVETYSSILRYPCKYLESTGFAIIQCGEYLNFFGADENYNCELLYSIDINKKNWFIGNISNDGEYLVTRDENGMQVRKLNQLECI